MKRESKKITTAIIKDIVNADGELIRHEEIKTFKVDREPDFIKLYIGDILRLKDIPKGMNAVLWSLLRRMNYQNEIVLIGYIKKQIEEELNIKDVTIRKSLETFVEKGIMIRKARGIYVFNPLLFGRGSWDEIRTLRLTVTYSWNKTEKEMQTEILTEQYFED
jgi:Firmicute plasmid replication protein (RepL)